MRPHKTIRLQGDGCVYTVLIYRLTNGYRLAVSFTPEGVAIAASERLSTKDAFEAARWDIRRYCGNGSSPALEAIK